MLDTSYIIIGSRKAMRAIIGFRIHDFQRYIKKAYLVTSPYNYYDYDYDYYDYCPEEVSRCRHRHVGPRFVHVTAIGPIYVENTLNADIIIGDKSSQKPTIQRSIIVLTSKLAAILVQCVIYAYTCMYLYNTHIYTYIYKKIYKKI